MQQHTINTPRFTLRNITLDDLDGMYALESNPAVYRYLSIVDEKTGEVEYPPVASKEELLERMQHIFKQYEETGMGRLAIISKETGDFVGWCGLKIEKSIRPETYYDLGYRLREEFWGQGIATEVAKACLDYGYNVMKLPAINAAADKTNLASDRVLHKIGLKRIDEFNFMGVDCWYYGQPTIL